MSREPHVPEKLHWFAAYVELRREIQVQAELRALGFDAYTPCETVEISHGGKKVAVQRPFLPRYVFVGLDKDSLNFPAVTHARGVDRLIGTAAGPTRLPYKWVSELRALETLRAFDHTYVPELVWEPGAEIRVVSGPCQGFVGEVIRVRGAKRVEVLIKALGALGDGVVVDTSAIREIKDAA